MGRVGLLQFDDFLEQNKLRRAPEKSRSGVYLRVRRTGRESLRDAKSDKAPTTLRVSGNPIAIGSVKYLGVYFDNRGKGAFKEHCSYMKEKHVQFWIDLAVKGKRNLSLSYGELALVYRTVFSQDIRKLSLKCIIFSSVMFFRLT